MEKPITSEQRKMLSKLYDQQINKRIEQAKSKRNEQDTAMNQTLLKSDAKAFVSKANKIKTLRKEANELEEELEKEIKNTGFRLESYSKECNVLVCNDHPKQKEFDEETRKLNEKMEEAKTRIMVDIWGLTGNYNEVCATIEKEFKTLGL